MMRIKRREDIIISSTHINYYCPSKIYLPILDTEKLLVKQNEKVLIGQQLSDTAISSVSGFFSKIVSIDNKKYIEVENDYKEDKEKINGALSIYELLQMINKKIEEKKYHKLIIKCYENDIYVRNNDYILNNYSNRILETVDIIMHKLNINNTSILISDNYTETLSKVYSMIGSYPEIKIELINNVYPIIYETEASDLVLSISEILSLNYLIFDKTYLDTTYLCVVGNAINTSCIINTKRNILASELIKENFNITSSNYHIIINGLLNGYEVNDFDFVVDSSIEAIFIMNNELQEANKCINCGECVNNCPVKNNPNYIMKHPNKKSSKIAIKRCLHCNTCSYVCPAKINISKYLGGKNE